MKITKRALCRWGAITGTAGIAGCAGTNDPDESVAESTETSTAVDTDAPLRATLVIDTERVLFTAADIETVGTVSESDGTGPRVPITLTEAGTQSVIEAAQAVDLDDTYQQAEIILTFDGEEFNRLGIVASLAESMASGQWTGSFILTFKTRSEAEMIRNRLLSDETGS